ncbi:MAG: AMP-binding protein [Synechococcales bacterium]|nr:AMP-binding protein [Synechococcales bacterium]
MTSQAAITESIQLTPQERQSLDQQVRYETVETLPMVWAIAADQFSDTPALDAPHTHPTHTVTFRQLWQNIQQLAAGLQSLGLQPGEHVALFSENGPRWFMADQGIMATGAVGVVRSSQADDAELFYILGHSDAVGLIVEDQKTLKRLGDRLQSFPLKFVVLLSDETPEAELGKPILNFPQLMEAGAEQSLRETSRSLDDLATLLYTSGTTGKPKGVMLTHRNLLHQINVLGSIVNLGRGDRILSILPTWHIYERTVEYFALSQGCTLVYTDLRHFKRDLQQQHPVFFVSVPRLLEAIYDAVQKQIRQQSDLRQRLARSAIATSHRYIQAKRIVEGRSLEQPSPSPWQVAQARLQMLALGPLHAAGDRTVYRQIWEGIGPDLRQIICGGGSLSADLDTFFEIIGLEVIVGYGLTETAPVLTARRPWHNLRGSAGRPILHTEVQIVDSQTRETLQQGQQGSVLVRGPQVMRGYYHNPEATAKVINADGWFDTEDQGWLTPQNDLILTGRVKDTIVLTNGENVEPQPIEEAIARSPFVDQIMVVGQDARSLGALIVPNVENLQDWAREHQVDLPPLEFQDDRPGVVEISDQYSALHDLFRQELNREVKDRPGFSPNDRIGPFRLLTTPFSIENGLMTQTLKIKRHAVTEQYGETVEEMFSRTD